MTPWIVTNLWLIPAVPLAASLLILAFANSRRRTGAALAIIGQLAAFALAVIAFLPDARRTRLARRSQFHLVHLRRTRAADRLGPRSARRRDAA